MFNDAVKHISMFLSFKIFQWAISSWAEKETIDIIYKNIKYILIVNVRRFTWLLLNS